MYFLLYFLLASSPPRLASVFNVLFFSVRALLWGFYAKISFQCMFLRLHFLHLWLERDWCRKKCVVDFRRQAHSLLCDVDVESIQVWSEFPFNVYVEKKKERWKQTYNLSSPSLYNAAEGKEWCVQLPTWGSLQPRHQETLGHLHLWSKKPRRRLGSYLRQYWCQVWVFEATWWPQNSIRERRHWYEISNMICLTLCFMICCDIKLLIRVKYSKVIF